MTETGAEKKKRQIADQYSERSARQIETLNRNMRRGDFSFVNVNGQYGKVGKKRHELGKTIRSVRSKQKKGETERVLLTTSGKLESLLLLRPKKFWNETDEGIQDGYMRRFMNVIQEYGTKTKQMRASNREEYVTGMLDTLRGRAVFQANREKGVKRREELARLSNFIAHIRERYEENPDEYRWARPKRVRGKPVVETTENRLLPVVIPKPARGRRSTSETPGVIILPNPNGHATTHPNPEMESKTYALGKHTLRITGPRTQGGRERMHAEPPKPTAHPQSLEARIRAGEPMPYDKGLVRKVSIGERVDKQEARLRWRAKNPWRRWKFAKNDYQGIDAAMQREHEIKSGTYAGPNAFMRGWNATKQGIKNMFTIRKRKRRAA